MVGSNFEPVVVTLYLCLFCYFLISSSFLLRFLCAFVVFAYFGCTCTIITWILYSALLEYVKCWLLLFGNSEWSHSSRTVANKNVYYVNVCDTSTAKYNLSINFRHDYTCLFFMLKMLMKDSFEFIWKIFWCGFLTKSRDRIFFPVFHACEFLWLE